uniref:Odorant receptor n=1 Tax=Hedya nubiferana TaxID=572853 RepID=A0A223HCZ5_9NEOP|nr:putative odorant receptor OR3 [Hedya nubiferana]
MFFERNSHSEITSPKDLGYIKQVALSLNRIASWPLTKSKANKKYTFSVKRNIAYILFEAILLFLQATYVRNYKHTLSFFKMGHTYITSAMTVICLQRLTMPWLNQYREVAREFLEKIHLYNHKNKSDYAMKVYSRVEKICIFFTLFIHYQMYTGILLFNITPWYKNLKAGMFSSNKPSNGTFEHAMYLELPFDYLTNFTGYIFVFILGWVETYTVASTFCLGDLYLSLIVFHIWGNLKILKHSLESFPRINNQRMTKIERSWYTKVESEHISLLIKEIVNHHRLIMDFMSKTSNTFSFFLCIYFAFHQIIGCILLLECSKLDSEALGKYGPLTVLLFQQLIQISVIFELIGSQSETLIDSVYGLPWECMGLKNRKLVLFFLQNVREPISLKACGMVSIGVQTMAAIIKASCSYFIILRTFTSNEEMTSG